MHNHRLMLTAGVIAFFLIMLSYACQYDIAFSPPWKTQKAAFNNKMAFLKDDFFSLLSQANQSGKPVFIDFYTDWCAPCKRMDRDVFVDAGVVDYFNANFISLKVNAEKGEGLELAQKFGITTYPTLVFLDAKGVEKKRLVGFASAQKILKNAKKIN